MSLKNRKNASLCTIGVLRYKKSSFTTTKIVTSNNRNGITSKKPSTVFLMQNVDLGHTKVMKIRQRETLSDQGAIIHEVCCCTAQLNSNVSVIAEPN